MHGLVNMQKKGNPMASKPDTPRKRKPPAYMEYASDILANQDWRMMSFAERGLWDTLRKECWHSEKVPSNPKDLALLLSKPVEEISALLTDRVLKSFHQHDGWLVCPELEDYRHKLDHVQQRMSEGGKKGGKTTQRLSRIAKTRAEAYPEAPQQATIKPLRRDESIREAVSRKKTIPFTTEQEEWVRDYDKTPDASETRYGNHRG
jgi:hypothetical protein